MADQRPEPVLEIKGLTVRLPEGADPCGENGEFHTIVQF